MGSTLINFKDRGFDANDSIMAIWLLLLVDEIDMMKIPPDWLRETREEWYLQGTSGFGFGVMPSLDNLLTSSDKISLVLNLSTGAMTRLDSYGEVISKEDLNRMARATDGSIFTENIKTQLFRDVGLHFIQLLRRE